MSQSALRRIARWVSSEHVETSLLGEYMQALLREGTAPVAKEFSAVQSHIERCAACRRRLPELEGMIRANWADGASTPRPSQAFWRLLFPMPSFASLTLSDNNASRDSLEQEYAAADEDVGTDHRIERFAARTSDRSWRLLIRVTHVDGRPERGARIELSLAHAKSRTAVSRTDGTAVIDNILEEHLSLASFRVELAPNS
jgi:hypothetical protein